METGNPMASIRITPPVKILSGARSGGLLNVTGSTIIFINDHTNSPYNTALMTLFLRRSNIWGYKKNKAPPSKKQCTNAVLTPAAQS